MEVTVLILMVALAGALWGAFRRLFRWPESALSAEHQDAREHLMERCRERIHRLEAERQDVSALIDEAEDLKYRLAGSEAHRSRIPLIDRSLDLLRRKAHLLDQLLGRYYRQHHELKLAIEADHFQQHFEAAIENHKVNLMEFRDEINRLDEEYQQLLLEAEAQVEVESLLREE